MFNVTNPRHSFVLGACLEVADSDTRRQFSGFIWHNKNKAFGVISLSVRRGCLCLGYHRSFIASAC